MIEDCVAGLLSGTGLGVGVNIDASDVTGACTALKVGNPVMEFNKSPTTVLLGLCACTPFATSIDNNAASVIIRDCNDEFP